MLNKLAELVCGQANMCRVGMGLMLADHADRHLARRFRHFRSGRRASARVLIRKSRGRSDAMPRHGRVISANPATASLLALLVSLRVNRQSCGLGERRADGSFVHAVARIAVRKPALRHCVDAPRQRYVPQFAPVDGRAKQAPIAIASPAVQSNKVYLSRETFVIQISSVARQINANR